MTRYLLTAGLWDEPHGDGWTRHRAGDVVSPSKDDAERLLRAGAIVPVTKATLTVNTDGAPDGTVTVELPVTVVAETDASQDASTTEQVEKPRKSAPRAVWVQYATDVAGLTPEAAEALTRAELIAAVG